MERLARYRPWFYAAAAYNVAWGAFVVLWPEGYFRILNLPLPTYLPIWQGVGMIVGVYALGYWLIARDPVRYGPFVWIGLLGKVFGPIGCLLAALKGDLPWSFGWINLTNDIIWLPAFIGFALELVRAEREKIGQDSANRGTI
ncbi:MAG: alkyl hydroperoxide reductase [Fimbriimonas sp.]